MPPNDANGATVVSASSDLVELAFDVDWGAPPWLGLPPGDPVRFQKLLYQASFTAFWASGRASAENFTSMTRATWRHPPRGPETPTPTRASCRFADHGFIIDFDDGASSQGTGVAITDRDVAAWRAQTKRKVLERAGDLPPFPSLDPHRFVVLDDVTNDGQLVARGCVTAASGFHPAHPFHTGSGDHVNVAQLVDCVQQLFELHLGEGRCTGGSGGFQRFLELDVPFTLRARVTHEAEERAIATTIHQVGQDNAALALTFTR